MRITVTALLVLISALSFGQTLQDTLLKELKPFDVKSTNNLKLVAGRFSVSDGLDGYTYTLDSAGGFERAEFADIGGSQVSEKGKFNAKAYSQIELRSEKSHSTFAVFSFDTIFFLVPRAKVNVFKEDFTKAVSYFGKQRTYKVGDESNTAYFMIAFSLLPKYLVKGLD
jgi:hypothetical protein